MQETYCFTVSGRVQGVSFRAAARHAAQRLGLRGWVRNTSDGCVEGVAAGDRRALDEFRDWLWQGPAAAAVEAVVFEPATDADLSDEFVVR